MTPAMNIVQATRSYEEWLAKRTRVLKGDLRKKHDAMAHDAFSFLRATFYRWAQLFPALCPGLNGAPTVLAVGDLHVENFGTWRDAEGRLVWGVNDCDEAFPLSYTADLTRLATSALLAIATGDLSLDPAKACAAILSGYETRIASSGEPFVLSEKHRFLRAAVTSGERDPVSFWEKMAALKTVGSVPANVRRMLRQAMPEECLEVRIAHRLAGLGSLGRERFTAIAEWRGGKIAREAKVLLSSACTWAAGIEDDDIHCARLLATAVRTPDPFLAIHDGWVLRRLSPYCSRIELSQLPRSHDTARLLRNMGRELANIHLGSRRAVTGVRRDLAQRKTKWLRGAAETMLEATLEDWKNWRKWMK
jgi:hypothetical protein